MDALRGIYHKGIVELIERPGSQAISEVLVIFPEKKKKVYKVGGLFKKQAIDYSMIEKELKKLDQQSIKHMTEELEE
ncbi:MAG: hypothetical protein Q7T53_07680 [Deltaproteobacteria bacterium]|nr:hypothetical protein [Deltaproteobacteria bacterium]